MFKQPKKSSRDGLIGAVVQDVELTAEQMTETAKDTAEAAGGVMTKVARLFRHDPASRRSEASKL